MKSNIKLLYIFAIILLANTYTKAQVNAGETFLQGSLNANKSFNDLGFNNGRYSGSIDWGKYVSKNSANILSLTVSYEGATFDSQVYKNNVFRVGLAKGHEYYKPIFGKFGMYGRIMGGVNYSNSVNDINYGNGGMMKSNEITEHTIGVNLFGNGGLMYRLNDRWAFSGQLFNLNVASVGYNWKDEQRIPTQGATATSTKNQFSYNFSPNISFSFGIGIRYILK